MTMHRSLSTVSIVLFCSACSGAGPETAVESTTQTSETFLQEMVRDEHFTGVALVMKEGQIVHSKGYGDATQERENAVTTVFHVASITKQFTAAAVMQLVEQGKVELDASVNEYLPQEYQSPKWATVHIHHLLSHTSGVPDYAVTRDYYNVVRGFCLGDTVDGMVKEAMAKDLEFSPGSKFSYSNIGFTLLGFVIEHVTSTPFDEYVKINILTPMGMESSRIHVEGHVPVPDEAEGHRWNEEQGVHVPDDVVSLPVTAPDGGLVTTLSDFAKWTEIYMGGQHAILTQESLDAMTNPVTETGWKSARGLPQRYGYSLFLGDSSVSHVGYIVGFRSYFFVDREEQLLIAVFTNNTTSNPVRIAAGLLGVLDMSLS